MNLNSSKLTKFIDILSIPKIAKANSSNCYEMVSSQFQKQLHSELQPTTIWGINNSYPGETIIVKENEEINVKWINNLPCKHMLPIDKTIYDAGNTPEVRNVFHLHGGINESRYDGYPLAWFTKNYEKVGPNFQNKVYKYHNKQEATLLWYHDHTMGVTRLNNYAGLMGLYIIRSEYEKKLNLPCGSFEIPLVIQDKCFLEDGSIHYPKNENDYGATKSMKMSINMHIESEKDMNNNMCFPNNENLQKYCNSIVPEFIGDTILVNGKIWPYLDVEPRKYRFRVLNGSNSRFYNLYLDNDRGFYQIGTDLGFLNKPIKLKKLLLAPAERADIIIDFSKFKEKEIILKNNANTPYPKGTEVDENTSNIMKFKIIDKETVDNSCIPTHLNKIPNPQSLKVDKIRKITLIHTLDKYDREVMLLDNKTILNAIDIKPKINTTEVWEIYNQTEKAHPMHIHLLKTQILNYQDFKLENEKIVFTSSPYLPPINEQGYKDTIKIMPNTVARVIFKITPYTGKYLIHCHMLEHEDHDMMRTFEIIN